MTAAGAIFFSPQPAAADQLRRMADAMSTAATEGPALWTSPEATTGMALLALPGAGRLVTGGGVVVVADARIDNRLELWCALRSGNDPVGRDPVDDDADLVHRALLRWGTRCVEHLVGDFALLAWDEHSRTAFAAVDQTGRRVLYYHELGPRLALASEPKGLLALPGVDRRLREAKLAQHLVLVRDDTTSFYEGIHRLPAAHCLVAQGRGARVSRYWSAAPHQPLRRGPDDEHLRCFRETFREAVACRLPAGSPPGVMLSGGLDSGSVAAVAADLRAGTGDVVRGYTSVPDATDLPARAGITFDETPLVEALGRRHPNLALSFVGPGGHIPLDVVGEIFAHAEAPPMNPDNQVWMEAIHRAAASDGVKVLLTGQAGNATISYSGLQRMVELARRGRWLALRHEVRARAGVVGAPASRVLEEAVISELLPERLRHLRLRLRGRQAADDWKEHSAINPRFAKRYDIDGILAAQRTPRDGREARAAWAEKLNGGAEVAAARRAIYGIELRDPTGDVRVRDLCLAMPLDQFFRNGQDRSLIRRAMAGLVPDEVLLNRVRGRQAADWNIRLSAARHRVESEVRWMEASDLARRVLDVPRIRHALLNWPERFRPDDTTVYQHMLQRALVMGAFLRWFEEGGGPAATTFTG